MIVFKPLNRVPNRIDQMFFRGRRQGFFRGHPVVDAPLTYVGWEILPGRFDVKKHFHIVLTRFCVRMPAMNLQHLPPALVRSGLVDGVSENKRHYEEAGRASHAKFRGMLNPLHIIGRIAPVAGDTPGSDLSSGLIQKSSEIRIR